MKRGLHGLKVQQVSFILIGLVGAMVLVVMWKKATVLTSFIPIQSHILNLDKGAFFHESNWVFADKGDLRGVLGYKNSSGQTEGNKFKLVGSTLTEPGVKIGNSENMTTSPKSDILPIEIQRERRDEHSEEETKSEKSGRQSEGLEKFVITEPFVKSSQTKNSLVSSEREDCNYAKGKWVFDDSLPLYSGYGCRKWLSPMWACRLTQRKDFEYEKLRWKPKDCKMQEFTASKFLKRMQNKTLAFVGDSLGRQQFQSIMCMVTGGNKGSDVVDVGHEFGLVKAHGSARPDGWAYRFPSSNTTILYYWSASLCNVEPINVTSRNTDFAMHLDQPPAFLRRFLNKFDVLVLNTGHHWNRGKLNANRWIMYIGGAPNTNRKLSNIGAAKNFAVHSIIKWVDSQLPNNPGLKAFFRSISPRHFFNGEWNTGGTCDSTTPRSSGMEISQDDSSDPLAAAAVNGTSVKLLDITALSQLRDEGHISRYSIKATPGVQDCLHWCLPGVPDTWNEILFAQI